MTLFLMKSLKRIVRQGQQVTARSWTCILTSTAALAPSRDEGDGGRASSITGEVVHQEPRCLACAAQAVRTSSAIAKPQLCWHRHGPHIPALQLDGRHAFAARLSRSSSRHQVSLCILAEMKLPRLSSQLSRRTYQVRNGAHSPRYRSLPRRARLDNFSQFGRQLART